MKKFLKTAVQGLTEVVLLVVGYNAIGIAYNLPHGYFLASCACLIVGAVTIGLGANFGKWSFFKK